MSRILTTLNQRFAAAMAQAFGAEHGAADPQIRAATNPQFGDFQSNAAMGLAGKLGKAPRAVAQEIVAKLDLSGVALAPEIAGPGFINIRLEAAFLESALAEVEADPAKAAARAEPAATIVIDYSSPNVAKEMHVGHLRSTIIGDAIARVLGAFGHRILRQNHLGDWGTQFGMLIEHIVDLGWQAEGEHSIADLNELYKAAKAKFDADPAFADRARRRVVALQAGDPGTLRLWQLLISESKHHFESVYATLGVQLSDADYCGESFYNPHLVPTIEELVSLGQAVESDGALCLFPPGFPGPDDKPSPLILRKSDGGYGYDTTDMAAIRYRIRELGGQRLIYVTDARQRQHFAMVFKAAEQAGWVPAGVSAEHVYFGSVLGDDGKPFKSRSGETVKLAELLDEAVRRARALVDAKSPQIPEAERAAIATTIGIGAIKYADLSNDRIKDYVFSWERMLAFDGNTAPYLQYAYVRIQSIFRKAGEQGHQAGPILLASPEERALALKMLSYGECLAGVARSLEPHRLCTWLYELATAFHNFFEKCPVLVAPEAATRASRLALSALTARYLREGLALLGIGVVDRM